MAWIDQQDTLETEDEDGVEATFGYCEKCGGLHVECPRCATLNAISEWPKDEWIECEGGCGVVEFHLRREMVKDDPSNPTHDRLTLRITA